MNHLIHAFSSPSRRLIYYIQLYMRYYIPMLLGLWLLSSVMAQDIPTEWLNETITNCSTITDNYVGNAQLRFQFKDWVNRGRCIRQGTDGGGPYKTYLCYSRLQSAIANNLNEIRKAEYNGAAGVLALLPTIGALLGTPTNEIWRLLTMIPFGGFLAMACSFGGAILPVKIKDYESAFMKKNIKGDLRGSYSSLALPTTIDSNDQNRIKERADILMRRVQKKLQSGAQKKVPKMYILVGLTGMSILLLSAQVAMIVVELGAILPWWCISKWWVHLWYMMDNYVQLPFEKQWRLCLSDVPYDLTVLGGDDITNHLAGQKHETENVKTALKQLKSFKTGTVKFTGRQQSRADAINTLFVQVSVTSHSHNWRRTFTRSLSKITSIAVFIVGTACFASAQLLSIAIATFILTCVLGAGVFSRAITSWIVAGIETADPMLHFVADEDEEAYYVLARLFMINLDDTAKPTRRKVQVELGGNIFVDRRRITTRSPWPARFLGILTSPYDVARAVYKTKEDDGVYDLHNLESGLDRTNSSQQPLLRPALTSKSTFKTDISETVSMNRKALSRQSTFQSLGRISSD
ncbi:unnamed protein product [Alternaria alternata]